MKRHTMAHMQEGGVNVTPLIDIVMVLIVFFMLVAKIGVTRGEDSDIPLPSVILGKKLESLSNTFTLNVHWNHNGEEPGLDALVDGSKRDLHVTKQYSGGRSDTELFRVLDAFHKSHPDMNLIIRADQDMPYRQLELVLLAAAGAEIGNISYEARAKPRRLCNNDTCGRTMKLGTAKKVHYESGPNMTPLVDVVMVILIFLMLAGHFGGQTTFLVSKQGIKKSGGAGRPLKPGEVPDTPLEIRVSNLDPTGNNPGFLATGTGLSPTHSIETVQTWLASRRKAYNAAGTPNDKILVTLSPTRDVKYKYLIDVYQAALQAGYEKIAFTTSH